MQDIPASFRFIGLLIFFELHSAYRSGRLTELFRASRKLEYVEFLVLVFLRVKISSRIWSDTLVNVNINTIHAREHLETKVRVPCTFSATLKRHRINARCESDIVSKSHINVHQQKSNAFQLRCNFYE